jgi:hypothetical protein
MTAKTAGKHTVDLTETRVLPNILSLIRLRNNTGHITYILDIFYE